MESQEEAKKKKSLMPILMVLMLGVIIALVAFIFMRQDRAPEQVAQVEIDSEQVPRIGYANGAVILDEDALQLAVNDLYSRADPGLTLSYVNDAYSVDGINFSCYLENAAENVYDMYYAIYGDSDCTDELFLSQLLRPGTGFDHITLNHPLEQGTHQVYVIFTQVSEQDGVQSLYRTFQYTMDFHVGENELPSG